MVAAVVIKHCLTIWRHNRTIVDNIKDKNTCKKHANKLIVKVTLNIKIKDKNTCVQKARR